MPKRKPAIPQTRAERIIAFCETYLVIPEGMHVGKPVVLRDWQRDIIRKIYDEGETRQAIISLARKNGKTALIAMLVLVHLVGPEARQNAQIYSAAQSREQAAIVFSYASKMARMSMELNQLLHIKDTAKEIICSLTGVKYRALSADATTAYGLSPVLVIHDELGQVRGPRSELFDALETAMGAQHEPLSIVISTQAPTDADLLSVLIDDANLGHDPKRKAFLFAALPDDDMLSPETWAKANPALGDFRSLQDMEEAAKQAKRLPAFEASFRNLFLNQRVAAENHFLTPSVWALNAGEPDYSVFEDSEVYGGLDLSGRQDLTALVLVARDSGGIWHILPHFWAPSVGIYDRAKRDKAPYDVWRDQGFLTATPGSSIDYGFIAEFLGQVSYECNLKLVRFDRWRIADLQRELDERRIEVKLEPHGQGYRDMSPALDVVEAEAVNGRLRHGNHPILKWNAANCIVTADPAGNRKLDKSKATGRIDGMQALAMALGGASAEQIEPAADSYLSREGSSLLML